MAGQQAVALQAPSAGELAELAISATNSEQNVMGELRVLIALSLGWVANIFENERSEARLRAKIWHNKLQPQPPMDKNRPTGNHQMGELRPQSHAMRMALQVRP